MLHSLKGDGSPCLRLSSISALLCDGVVDDKYKKDRCVVTQQVGVLRMCERAV